MNIVPTRFTLQGASNFRDLGGIPAADGRRLRHGLLYRSDSLAELTEDDLERIAAIGLRTICDLRHESERNVKPNRLPAGHGIRQLAIGFLPRGAHDLFERLGPDTDELAVINTLNGYYRCFPLDHAGNYGRMFGALLAEDGLPLLIHCTSGKDRTGFGIALVLMALGVSRENIVADYLLSNRAPRDLRFMVSGDVPADALQALMQVREEYLQASFAAIDAHWPSPSAFLEAAIGVSHTDQSRLREQMLE